MQIKQLYEKYQIMPQLEKHQLRVGAIGKIIAENWIEPCDVQLVTKVCLLHDMGNIVKFDLTSHNIEKFGEITEVELWREIQKVYINKYGKDANDATTKILNEARLGEYGKYVVEETKLYFAEAKDEMLSKASLPAIILMYADCRVVPKGLVSYRERIDDLQERYGGIGTPTWYDWTFWFENWMQSKVKIDLNSITEESVEPLFDELRNYVLETD